jgi:1-acyl-sn-glycerol-3-phosphate acyltransferase
LAWRSWNALQLVFTIAWTTACICLAQAALALAGGNRRVPLGMASRLWAPGLLIGAGAKLRVEGLERVDFSKPHVFVANHQSMIDVCALFRVLRVPIRFVIKQELEHVPFIGWYARSMGMVFIKRGHACSRADVNGTFTPRPPQYVDVSPMPSRGAHNARVHDRRRHCHAGARAA